MNKLLVLYRTLRKSDAAKSANSPEDNEHSVSLSTLISIVCVVLAVGGIGYVGYQFAGAFEIFGGVNVVLSVVGLVAGIVLAIKGIIQLVNSLYMSTDTALLITMPLSPLTLAAVRLANTLFSSLLIMAGLLLSFSLGYCVTMPTGPAFWIGICLYILLVPLFVTLVAAALSIVLMSAFRIFRSRNAVKYIGVFGALIGTIAYMGWVCLSSSDIDLGRIIGTALNFTKNYTQWIPVIPFIHAFMDTGSFLSALLAILITAAALTVCLAAVKCLYLRSVVSMQDTAASSKPLKGRALEKIYEAKDPRASYRRKELLLLRRNPTYLLKDFIITFGWPLLIVPLFLVSIMSAIPESTAAADVSLEFAPDALATLLLTMGVVWLVVVVLNMFSDISYSSIIREGNMFDVMKQLPLSYREQVRAKRNLARNIVGIATLGYLTVAAIAGVILGVVPWYAIPYGLFFGLPLLYLVVDIDMIFGINGANIHWDNEATAIRKKGKLTLGSYLLVMLVLFGLVFLYVFLQSHRFLALPCLIAIPVALTVAAVLTDRHMYALAEAKLPDL